MDTATQDLIRETFDTSNQGRIHFGEVVARMMKAGVESYDVDYRAHRTTYYLGGAETLSLEMDAPAPEIAEAFDADAVKAGIRGSQQGAIRYPEFKRLSMAAGCVRYIAWIAGRQVTYFGRKGEMHIERFPT